MAKKTEGKKDVRFGFVIDEKSHELSKLIVSHKKIKDKQFTMGKLIREGLSLCRTTVTDPELIKKIRDFEKAWGEAEKAKSKAFYNSIYKENKYRY